ncbi:MAG: hypothetical protein SAK29_16565 [Scytonema sp. PMC 1069.18]|nr:hypothetical protein [Scytonema sp. PMC 1069.18]MEC4885521.1 hypothetical protein [Scytonema sp. PMC 1070.18]
MALFFLIPLLTGLLGGYIFKKSNDEIGSFVGIFAVICLALSLFLAPWQVLLLLLLFVLLATKKLLQRVEDSPEQLNQNGQQRTSSFSSRNF